MMELPTLPRPGTPNEPSTYDQFTVVQLITLHQQLRSIAPSGVVMYKILVDTMYSLSHTSVSVFRISRNIDSDFNSKFCLYGSSSILVLAYDIYSYLVIYIPVW